MPEAITVHCPGCETAFPVDPDKVPPGGVRARCSVCAEIFPVDGTEGEEPAHEGEAPARGAEGMETSAPFGGEAGTSGEAGLGDQEAETDGFERAGPAVEEPAGESEAAEAAGETDGGFEAFDTQIDLDADDDPFGGAEGASDTAVEEPPAGAPTEEPPTEAPAEEEPAEAEPAPRPTFGQRSPEEKAERLARVLVSDMISYNPELYEEAVEQGTLKEDFEEEIQKSWEEYVEQVGDELAESTSYWTDALNDILAKGENVFQEGWSSGEGEH